MFAISPGFAHGEDAGGHTPALGPADAIVASVQDQTLRVLLADVLERNPEIAALEARMAATG